MQNRIFSLFRRIIPLFGLLLASILLVGCNSDSNDGVSGSKGKSAIVLNYDGKSVRATTHVSTVNAMFVAKDYHVTIIAGWLAPENPEKRSGIITTRLTLSGESETTIATGSYVLEDQDHPSGSMTAGFVVEGAPYGLPKTLTATSGTLKIESVGVSESGQNPRRSKVDHIKLSYDGTFKNGRDKSDATQYKLAGSIVYAGKK